MKFIIPFVFACFFSISSLAQSTTKAFNVVKGASVDAKKSSIHSVVTSDRGDIFVIRKERLRLYLERINDKANTVNSEELVQKYESLYKEILGGFFLNEKLYLRFQALDKKNKTTIVIVEEFDTGTLKSKRVAHLEKITSEARGRAVATESRLSISPNKQFAMLLNAEPHASKKDQFEISIRVMNSEFEETWSKTIALPYADGLFSPKGNVLDNSGNAHVLAQVFKDKAVSVKDKKSNFKYHVVSFLNQGSEVKDNVLEVRDLFVTDVSIAINQKGDLITTGFYSKKPTMNSIDGVFSAGFDIQSGSSRFLNTREFDIDFITQFLSEKEEEKAKKKEEKGKDQELWQYDLKSLLFTDDGGWIMVAEQAFVVVHTVTTTNSNGGTTTSTYYVYYHNDVITVKVNAAGEFEWLQKVPKRQTSRSPNHLSYVMGYDKGPVYFVYNDVIENYGKAINPKGLSRYLDQANKKSIIAVATVQPNGELIREILTKDDKDQPILTPIYSATLKDGRALLYYSTRKTYQFGIMSMK
jgi:hypothetical protein